MAKLWCVSTPSSTFWQGTRRDARALAKWYRADQLKRIGTVARKGAVRVGREL